MPASAWGIQINVHLFSLHLSLPITTWMVRGAVIHRMTSKPHTPTQLDEFLMEIYVISLVDAKMT